MLAPLPAETDMLVIGGGLAGCALAYFLAKEGVEVALLERGELNREASGTNAGSFHFQIAIHQLTASDTAEAPPRLHADVRLHAEAASIWSALEDELRADRRARHRRPDGRRDAGRAALLIHKQRIEQDAGLETELLTGRELRDFAPYLADDLAGAVYCGQEGHANPLLAAPAFAPRAIEAARDPHARGRRDRGRGARRPGRAPLHRRRRRAATSAPPASSTRPARGRTTSLRSAACACRCGPTACT